jgi:acyl-homoserine lactone acylase PvdQ
LQSFQNVVIRKLAGLANQHKKLVLLGTIGVAHVYGKTDADAVFGCFAQCEDDFKRVEMNYIEKLGRL